MHAYKNDHKYTTIDIQLTISPGVTEGRGSVFKAHSPGHPLKRGELKVLEGTHGTEPMGLLGVEMELEKHNSPPPKNTNDHFLNVNYFTMK